jgi:heme A synthase
MTGLRRLSWFALGLAFAQSAFGAIVRISGSGMGCGEHWPDCNGALVPTITNYTVAIEITHRILAAMLLVTTGAIVLLAFRRQRLSNVGGPGDVLRAALLAVSLEIVAALVGMAVVLLALSNRSLIAVHYTIAMAILATLVVTVQRTGGLGAALVTRGDVSRRTYRGAAAAAGLAFVTVVFGALTANLAGAAQSCLGFPWCRLGMADAMGTLHVQLTHRVLALLLFLHLLGLGVGVTRRGEARAIVRAVWAAFGIIILQVVIAASLVELGLPPVLQSLHQATGTLLWVAVFTFAALARRGASPAPIAQGVGVPRPAGVVA